MSEINVKYKLDHIHMLEKPGKVINLVVLAAQSSCVATGTLKIPACLSYPYLIDRIYQVLFLNKASRYTYDILHSNFEPLSTSFTIYQFGFFFSFLQNLRINVTNVTK